MTKQFRIDFFCMILAIQKMCSVSKQLLYIFSSKSITKWTYDDTISYCLIIWYC